MSNEIRKNEMTQAMDQLVKAHNGWWNLELSKLEPARDAGEALEIIVKHNPGLTSDRKLAAALRTFHNSQGIPGPKVDHKTVCNYRRVFEKWDQIQAWIAQSKKKNVGYVQALKAIAAPKPAVNDGWKENEHGVSVKKYPSGREFFLSPMEGGYRLQMFPMPDFEIAEQLGFDDGSLLVKTGAKAKADEIDAILSKSDQKPAAAAESAVKALSNGQPVAKTIKLFSGQEAKVEGPENTEPEENAQEFLTWAKKYGIWTSGPYKIERKPSKYEAHKHEPWLLTYLDGIAPNRHHVDDRFATLEEAKAAAQVHYDGNEEFHERSRHFQPTADMQKAEEQSEPNELWWVECGKDGTHRKKQERTRSYRAKVDALDDDYLPYRIVHSPSRYEADKNEPWLLTIGGGGTLSTSQRFASLQEAQGAAQEHWDQPDSAITDEGFIPDEKPTQAEAQDQFKTLFADLWGRGGRDGLLNALLDVMDEPDKVGLRRLIAFAQKRLTAHESPAEKADNTTFRALENEGWKTYKGADKNAVNWERADKKDRRFWLNDMPIYVTVWKDGQADPVQVWNNGDIVKAFDTEHAALEFIDELISQKPPANDQAPSVDGWMKGDWDMENQWSKHTNGGWTILHTKGCRWELYDPKGQFIEAFRTGVEAKQAALDYYQRGNAAAQEPPDEKPVAWSNLTDADANEAVAKGTCIVLFTAVGCGPCRDNRPTLVALAKENKAITFAEAPADDCLEFFGKHKVGRVPEIILFKHGEEVSRLKGSYSLEQLRAWLVEFGAVEEPPAQKPEDLTHPGFPTLTEQDLPPAESLMDEAQKFKKLKKEGKTIPQLADEFGGGDQRYVRNRLKLLRLTEEEQLLVREGNLGLKEANKIVDRRDAGETVETPTHHPFEGEVNV